MSSSTIPDGSALLLWVQSFSPSLPSSLLRRHRTAHVALLAVKIVAQSLGAGLCNVGLANGGDHWLDAAALRARRRELALRIPERHPSTLRFSEKLPCFRLTSQAGDDPALGGVQRRVSRFEFLPGAFIGPALRRLHAAVRRPGDCRRRDADSAGQHGDAHPSDLNHCSLPNNKSAGWWVPLESKPVI